MEAAGGMKGDSDFPSHLAIIRPIRTYVRLVRTNGNAGPSGDVLCICPHLISRSNPFEVSLKCLTCLIQRVSFSNKAGSHPVRIMFLDLESDVF